MPLKLNSPQTLKIDTVRITGFAVNVHPRSVTIHYARGYALGEKFVSVESGNTTFDGADLPVGTDSEVYKVVKGTLYQMLQGRVGNAAVE